MPRKKLYMSEAERRACIWLASTMDCELDAIRFQYRASPDFILPDGRGFEVKLLLKKHGRTFVVGQRQLELLRNQPSCWLLLWRKEGDSPEAMIPTTEMNADSLMVRDYRIAIDFWH